MKRIYPSISRECSQRQSDNRRYNPGSVAIVKHKGKTYSVILNSGTSDGDCFWQDRDTVYALSINTSLGYCGLTVYKLQDTPNKYKPGRFDADESASVFFQSDHEIESALGSRGLDLAPSTILKRLMEYCY